MKLSEYMDKAIGIIGTEEQWCRSVILKTENGVRQHCLAGALAQAVGLLDRHDNIRAIWDLHVDTATVEFDTYQTLYIALGKTVKEELELDDARFDSVVPGFNDDESTAYADAIAMMEKTRARLAEEGK